MVKCFPLVMVMDRLSQTAGYLELTNWWVELSVGSSYSLLRNHGGLCIITGFANSPDKQIMGVSLFYTSITSLRMRTYYYAFNQYPDGPKNYQSCAYFIIDVTVKVAIPSKLSFNILQVFCVHYQLNILTLFHVG